MGRRIFTNNDVVRIFDFTTNLCEGADSRSVGFLGMVSADTEYDQSRWVESQFLAEGEVGGSSEPVQIDSVGDVFDDPRIDAQIIHHPVGMGADRNRSGRPVERFP